MFTIRPYRPEDAMGCGECFYEGFFSCPIDANDRAFLRDYVKSWLRSAISLMSPLRASSKW